MNASNLLEILEKSLDWNDIYNQLTQYKNNDSGKLFELFCKYYYLADFIYSNEYKNVWLFSEIPEEIRIKLNLGKRDHGVDLALEGHDGSFSVVQCKFTLDQKSIISWTKNKLANLLADGDQADYFIIFTNASGLDKYTLTKKENRLKLVNHGELSGLSVLTINNMKKLLVGLIPNLSISKKKPKKYQIQAIESVIQGFKGDNRGQLILPCGTGKTLISLWIKEALAVKYTLVLVPSLALLRQLKKEWIENSKSFTPYICVCSEKDIIKSDNTAIYTYEINGKVTTNPCEVYAFLNKYEEAIVYSTYQSLDAVCDAVKNTTFKFDLAICDEAHRTSGSKISEFGLIHDDHNIQIKKRLYMTATPKVLAANLKQASEIEKYLLDMSDRKVFGEEFYRMSFKEAIDQKILIDYQIVAVGVSDQELQEAIKNRQYISEDETIHEIADNYALEKFMQTYKVTHAITFHSSVKKAKSFQERHQNLYFECNSHHVNGKQTTNERTLYLKEFECSAKSIVTNARCLTEGIDVPAIDVVYFCDPKNSKIDIVQAVGRALRRADHKNKIFGYIVVPIYHQRNDGLEMAIESSQFKNLISVIRALSSHDERLNVELKNFKCGKGKRKGWGVDESINDTCNIIILEGFHEKLQKALFAQLIDKYFPVITFAEKCPDLLQEWDFAKNTLDPYKISYGSKVKAFWHCKKGHEYEAILHVRANGHGCSYCSGKKVALENSLLMKAPLLAKELHPIKNKEIAAEISYSSNKKVHWLCEKGHEFEASVGNRYRGTKCPYCSGKKAHSSYNLTTSYPNLAVEWHQELNGILTPYDVTPGQKDKVNWRCKLGHVWEASILNRVTGTGCPECDGRKLTKSHNLVIKLPHLAKVFHPEKNYPLTPHDFTPGSNKVIWWKCKNGHEWKAAVVSRSKIDGNGCAQCSKRKPDAQYNLAVLHPDLAKEWHHELNDKLTPYDVTPGSKINAHWICKVGHVWQAAVYSRSSGHGCMKCRKKAVPIVN